MYELTKEGKRQLQRTSLSKEEIKSMRAGDFNEIPEGYTTFNKGNFIDWTVAFNWPELPEFSDIVFFFKRKSK